MIYYVGVNKDGVEMCLLVEVEDKANITALKILLFAIKLTQFGDARLQIYGIENTIFHNMWPLPVCRCFGIWK